MDHKRIFAIKNCIRVWRAKAADNSSKLMCFWARASAKHTKEDYASSTVPVSASTSTIPSIQMVEHVSNSEIPVVEITTSQDALA